MRTLRFMIDKQIIRQDPDCDFTNLVPGSEQYLKAEFSFSPDWDGSKRVAAFYSRLGTEYPPQVLTDGKTCMIPSEALEKKIFKVRIYGINPVTKQKLITNKVVVDQNGGTV